MRIIWQKNGRILKAKRASLEYNPSNEYIAEAIGGTNNEERVAIGASEAMRIET